jgi:hypothetical protein
LERHPKKGKKPTKNPTDGFLPEKKPQKKPCGVTKAQVAPADAEAQMQPSNPQGSQKQQIRKGRQTGAKGAQKVVNKPQNHADQTGRTEAACCQ